MSRPPQTTAPSDAAARRAIKPLVCYPVATLPAYDEAFYEGARTGMTKVSELMVPPNSLSTALQ